MFIKLGMQKKLSLVMMLIIIIIIIKIIKILIISIIEAIINTVNTECAPIVVCNQSSRILEQNSGVGVYSK